MMSNMVTLRTLIHLARSSDDVLLHCVLASQPNTFLITSTKNVAHYIQDNTILFTLRATENIVAISSFEGTIVAAGMNGNIWLIPWREIPRKTTINLVNSLKDVSPPKQGNLSRNTPRNSPDEPDYTYSKRKRHRYGGHANVIHSEICIPGIHAIICSLDGFDLTLIALSLLCPSTFVKFSLRTKSSTSRVEYEELEGEKSTSVFYTRSDAVGGIFFSFPDFTRSRYILLQGDADCAVRAATLDCDMHILSQATIFSFRNESIRYIFGLKNSSNLYNSIAIVGEKGRLVVLQGQENSTSSNISMDVQLLSPVDSVQYIETLQSFVYIACGACYIHGFGSSTSVRLPIYQKIKKIVLTDHSQRICCVARSGRVFLVDISSMLCKSYGDDIGRVSSSLQSETYNPEDNTKSALASIRHASENYNEILKTKEDMTCHLKSLLSVLLVSKQSQSNIYCPIQCEGYHICSDQQEVHQLSLQFHGMSTNLFPFNKWYIQVIVRDQVTNHTLQFTFQYPEVLPSFERIMSIDDLGFLTLSTVLEVQCYLVYDEMKSPFHFLLTSRKISIFQFKRPLLTSQRKAEYVDQTSSTRIPPQNKLVKKTSHMWKCYEGYAEFLPTFWSNQTTKSPFLSMTSALIAVLVGHTDENVKSIATKCLDDAGIQSKDKLNQQGFVTAQQPNVSASASQVTYELHQDKLLLQVHVPDISDLALIRAGVISSILTSNLSSILSIEGESDIPSNVASQLSALLVLESKWNDMEHEVKLWTKKGGKSLSSQELLQFVQQIMSCEVDICSVYSKSRHTPNLSTLEK
ncbi:hypothetical protein Ae201684_015478 [Aphanomyces euteiches]|uniref:Uncharacterized protein n=1 Tax=Aphanomyces euteiches TaxID=100861 RepID=A0A6G0WF94_9STRA|nr:hypothetical protein Ae201684_015478 [Aphanomyces euteiches]